MIDCGEVGGLLRGDMDNPSPVAPVVRQHEYKLVQVLRFVAALMVVVTHSSLYTSERLGAGNYLWVNGSRGVDLFFVISGFVMILTSCRLIDRSDGWIDFAVQRTIRIVPLYWLATTGKLIILAATPGLVYHAALDPWSVAKSYMFIPSINVDGEIKPLLAVGWTLIFEMFFYLLFMIGLAFRLNLYP